MHAKGSPTDEAEGRLDNKCTPCICYMPGTTLLDLITAVRKKPCPHRAPTCTTDAGGAVGSPPCLRRGRAEQSGAQGRRGGCRFAGSHVAAAGVEPSRGGLWGDTVVEACEELWRREESVDRRRTWVWRPHHQGQSWIRSFRGPGGRERRGQELQRGRYRSARSRWGDQTIRWENRRGKLKRWEDRMEARTCLLRNHVRSFRQPFIFKINLTGKNQTLYRLCIYISGI